MPETRYSDHLNVAFDMNNLGHLSLQTGERAAASEGGGHFKKEQDSLWETGHLGDALRRFSGAELSLGGRYIPVRDDGESDHLRAGNSEP